MTSVVRRFIEDAGNTTQALGLGRVVGQIYAYLYFSSTPRGLEDFQRELAISKGSASMVVRQLEQWGAARRVWVKGDRKDYYEANDWLGQILRNLLVDTIGKKLFSYTSLLDEATLDLSVLDAENGERDFVKARIDHLRQFHARVQKVWNNPIVKRLLK
jgi:DNA-binding transcriptional regulator GbsR (MarR family)